MAKIRPKESIATYLAIPSKNTANTQIITSLRGTNWYHGQNKKYQIIKKDWDGFSFIKWVQIIFHFESQKHFEDSKHNSWFQQFCHLSCSYSNKRRKNIEREETQVKDTRSWNAEIILCLQHEPWGLNKSLHSLEERTYRQSISNIQINSCACQIHGE